MSGFFFAVKHGEPSDEELSCIAEEISEVFKKLGRLLKVPECVLAQIGVNYKGNAHTMALRVLRNWKENSSPTSRYQALYEALTRIGRRDLAKKYCCH